MNKKEKFDLLTEYGKLVNNNSSLVLLVGFLAGRLENVRFVRELDKGGVQVRLRDPRGRLWGTKLFEATINGTPLPDPFLLCAALRDDKRPVHVRIDFADREKEERFRQLSAPSSQEAMAPEEEAEERLASLHDEVDRALDIYNECRKRLGDEPREDRQEELQFFLRLAEDQIETLSERIDELRDEIAEMQES